MDLSGPGIDVKLKERKKERKKEGKRLFGQMCMKKSTEVRCKNPVCN
jgi:hypothetical protein